MCVYIYKKHAPLCCSPLHENDFWLIFFIRTWTNIKTFTFLQQASPFWQSFGYNSDTLKCDFVPVSIPTSIFDIRDCFFLVQAAIPTLCIIMCYSSVIHSVYTVTGKVARMGWDLFEKLSFVINLKKLNPLLPIAHKSARIDKILILKLEGIIKKISYERRDYESVDEKSQSKAMSRKTTKKRIQALKG